MSTQPEMSGFDLRNTHTLSQAPSIISLRVPQDYLGSGLATAATSMLTVVPAEDEKDMHVGPGPSEEGQNVGETREATQPAATPQVALTFLLVSGSRRTMIFDPETTVGRVKELVWNAWPNGTYTKKNGLFCC